ncbi:MAG: pyridoxamine 5'-phosphate oxidase family protein [Pseudomonadota bacterium]
MSESPSDNNQPDRNPPDLKKKDRSRVRRQHNRGHYDRETVDTLLDAALIGHIAYVIDDAPYCTPTLVWRGDDHVYWHGSSISRFLQQVEGRQACVTVTHFDGLVLARSAFHHSANYRSVMLFGEVEVVTGETKERALVDFMEGILPGRWDSLRTMTRKELNATTVLRMPIDEGAAKIRTGPPADDKKDYELPIWAGVVPFELRPVGIEPDPANLPDVRVPDEVAVFAAERDV